MFTDTLKINYVGKIGVVVLLLTGRIKKGNIYHIVSWLSHKSKVPVKSMPAPKILAAAEGIDEGKAVAEAYSELFDSAIKLHLCVDFEL